MGHRQATNGNLQRRLRDIEDIHELAIRELMSQHALVVARLQRQLHTLDSAHRLLEEEKRLSVMWQGRTRDQK